LLPESESELLESPDLSSRNRGSKQLNTSALSSPVPRDMANPFARVTTEMFYGNNVTVLIGSRSPSLLSKSEMIRPRAIAK